MLKQRIITALILAPLALYAILFLPIFWFEIAIAGVVGIGAYEWAAMAGVCERPKKLLFMAGAFAICIALSLVVSPARLPLLLTSLRTPCCTHSQLH